jgi:hypothetical protein
MVAANVVIKKIVAAAAFLEDMFLVMMVSLMMVLIQDLLFSMYLLISIEMQVICC